MNPYHAAWIASLADRDRAMVVLAAIALGLVVVYSASPAWLQATLRWAGMIFIVAVILVSR